MYVWAYNGFMSFLLVLVLVTMQGQKESPPDMQCKDKFLLQSVVAPDGTTTKDVTSDMFNKEDGRVVEDFKLTVLYIPCKSSLSCCRRI